MMLGKSGEALSRKGRIISMTMQLTNGSGPHTFVWCECQTMEPRLCQEAYFVVAAIFNQRTRDCYDSSFNKSATTAVADHNVRRIAGVFWISEQET